MNVFLADDDEDDRLFFEEALREVCTKSLLLMADNGERLMQLLRDRRNPQPDVLFLDLNMPKKNGYECLTEIRSDEKLRHIPIVIFTTSQQEDSINAVYQQGAHFYIRKPNDFSQLKSVVRKALTIDWAAQHAQPEKERFILTP